VHARSRVLTALTIAALGLCLLAPAQARPAPIGQDPIKPGQVYSGDFPDPSVIRVGSEYYAYSTNSGGLNVPSLTSTDLKTWHALPGTTTDPTGDALPRTPVWSAGTERKDGRFTATTWAPTVTRLGPGRYVMAYATQVAGSPGQRMCISLATSNRPTGPFVDNSTAPTLCPERGAIDPQVFVAPTGRPWLIWKLDHMPAQLFASPMNASGTALPVGGHRYLLTGVRQPWEGSIIENPAMIHYRHHYYLFYSANSYASTRYAIGYLICENWFKKCTRPRKKPLLSTVHATAGPGGPMPFTDTAGRLRLAYAAWTTGSVGYPSSTACRTKPTGCGQRRLNIATLGVTQRTGQLTVRSWH
jgi:beta-xylosidase